MTNKLVTCGDDNVCALLAEKFKYFIGNVDSLPVGKKVKNQLKRSIGNPSVEFIEKYLLPYLWQSNDQKYICISDNPKVLNRNYDNAKSLIENDSVRSVFSNNIFTNRLSVDDAKMIAPKDRLVIDGPVVFTIEFDNKDAGFFEKQMSWCRYKKNKTDSPIGSVFKHFSEFIDFKGITVCWSGNKSLHIHLVFDSSLFFKEMKVADSSAIRNGYMKQWEEISAVIQNKLEIPKDIAPDKTLKSPEQFRRLPWGTRIVNQDNFLKIPKETKVPQVVVWEKWRSNAGSNCNGTFFRLDFFTSEACSIRNLSKPAKRISKETSGILSSDDQKYCENKLRVFIDSEVSNQCKSGPILSSLYYEGQEWKARFYNSPFDKNPSSIMRGAYSSILYQGKDLQDVADVKLPKPLGEMIELWMLNKKYSEEEVELLDVPFQEDDSKEFNEIEKEYREKVVDKDSAWRETEIALMNIVQKFDVSIIKGPEGSGKSTALFNCFDKIKDNYLPNGKYSMFAFSTYDMADQKMKDFNKRKGSEKYKAVLLVSFEREYENACRAVNVEPLKQNQRGKNLEDLISKIEKIQPSVWGEMKKNHFLFWTSINKSQPVFFTVHGVAEHWGNMSKSRRYWHRDFFNKASKKSDKCRLREMDFDLLVYDEVSIDSFVYRHSEECVEFIEGLKKSSVAWANSTSSRVDKEDDFKEAMKEKKLKLTYDQAVSIESIPLDSRVLVTNHYHCEYSERVAGCDEKNIDIYKEECEKNWYVLPRKWWEKSAKKVVILTTESLPVLVARRLGISVFELECPKIERTVVNVHFDRFVNSKNVSKAIAVFKGNNRNDFSIVSNHAKCLSDSFTHHSAKGANHLKDKNIVQTMLYVGPDEYALLEVLNAWLGINYAVRLRHVDEFNQTAGRNCGFRWNGNTEHHLLISRSLCANLIYYLSSHSRYGLRLHFTGSQRKI
jgi:hypothetical protein